MLFPAQMKMLNVLNKKGFTLIELLVVLFIIGALTGLLLPNLMGARERARDSQRKQDLFEIKSALRLYYNDNQSYPDAGDFSFGSAWTGYMALVPNDPKTGGEYYYCVNTDNEGFILAASLENAADSNIAESQARCDTAIICGLSCVDNCYFVCAH